MFCSLVSVLVVCSWLSTWPSPWRMSISMAHGALACQETQFLGVELKGGPTGTNPFNIIIQASEYAHSHLPRKAN